MAGLILNDNENMIRASWVQVAKGFPQSVGKLYLTNQRMLLVPNQILSIGFGKRLEIFLTEIDKVQHLGNFEGGTLVGGAGQKMFIKLKDGTMHTFSFWITENVLEFCSLCEDQLTPKTD